MQLPAHTVTDERGVERCMNVKEAAVENVKGDPSKGYHNTKVYCNQPMAHSISENRKICPACYKEPVVGFPEPKITNAGGVVLSPKEMEECGLNPDGTRIDGKTQPKKTIEATPQAVEAKVSEINKDGVNVYVPLAELEANEDVAAYLIRKVMEGFGTLPITNYAESKRVMKLEEKLESMLRA